MISVQDARTALHQAKQDQWVRGEKEREAREQERKARHAEIEAETLPKTLEDVDQRIRAEIAKLNSSMQYVAGVNEEGNYISGRLETELTKLGYRVETATMPKGEYGFSQGDEYHLAVYW